jgi:Rieske Fe-S protein
LQAFFAQGPGTTVARGTAPTTTRSLASQEENIVDRRQFCAHACQALSVTTLAALVDACGGSPTSPSSGAATLPTVPGSLSGRTLTVTVDAASPLATVGGAAFVNSSAGAFLLFRASQDAVTTLTSVCTHEGCAVTGISGQTFVCPCHGSQYSSSGAVVKGPAARPLQSFPTTFANGVVSVSV